MRLPCLAALLGALATSVCVQAQPPPHLTPVTASECPLTCLNGSTCGRHTSQSQGVALDAETGQIYWHDGQNASDRTGYRCICPPGWSGLACGHGIEACNSEAPPGLQLVCENGGFCIEGQDDSGLDFFVCDCVPAYDEDLGIKYVGRFCEIPVALEDYCAGNGDPNAFCVQGGTCRDFMADSSYDVEPCHCPADRTGKHCEFPSSAFMCTLECSNGGICRHGQKAVDSLPDEIIHGRVDPVRSENFMYCECLEGYTGSLCDYEYITCGGSQHYCFNNAVCQEIGDQFTCLCDIDGTPAAGEYCEFRATDQCNSIVVFDGTIDDTIEVLPHGKEFCVNGGQCIVAENDGTEQDFFCDCGMDELTGERYTGAHCQYINPVAYQQTESPWPTMSEYPTLSPPNPLVCNPQAPADDQKICLHGGQCIEGQTQDGSEAFVCDCQTAFDFASGIRYVGPMCEIPVNSGDYCVVDDPASFCVNGGTCRPAWEDNFDTQPCDCPQGNRGKHCEFSLSPPCDLDCGPNGVCRNGVKSLPSVGPDTIIHDNVENLPLSMNNMFCECSHGFAGSLCDYEYVTCGGSQHFCFHNAVCQQIGDGDEWTCLCDIDGVPAAGEYCEFQATDQCSSPVVYDGTIDDVIEVLPPGKEFCVKGGQCVVAVNDGTEQDFFCDCGTNEETGGRYTGRHCEETENSGTDSNMPTESPWYAFSPGPTRTWYPTFTQWPTRTSLPTSRSPVSKSVCNPEAPIDDQITCENGGLCVIIGTGASGCVCPEGFFGELCEIPFELVPSSSPGPTNPTQDPVRTPGTPSPSLECTIECGSNGACRKGPPRPGSEAFGYWHDTNAGPDFQFCECMDGHGGKYCEFQGESCGEFTCLNGGSCTDMNGRPMADRCNCLGAWESGVDGHPNVYYAGRFCQYPSTSICFQTDDELIFCTNGGACSPDPYDWCACAEGFAGYACEYIAGTDCNLDCGRNGHCRFGDPPGGSQAHTYWFDPIGPGSHQYCECDQGYGGKFCEFPGEDCGDFACLHGGRCDSLLPDRCNCLNASDQGLDGQPNAYYDGRFCQYASTSVCFESDEGVSFCTNNGQCRAEPHGGCDCFEGFTGFACEFVEGTELLSTMPPHPPFAPPSRLPVAMPSSRPEGVWSTSPTIKPSVKVTEKPATSTLPIVPSTTAPTKNHGLRAPSSIPFRDPTMEPILPLGPISLPCKYQVKYLDKYIGNCGKKGN